jgi:hypothetical protein
MCNKSHEAPAVTAAYLVEVFVQQYQQVSATAGLSLFGASTPSISEM